MVKMNGQRAAFQRMVFALLLPLGPTGGCGCAPGVVTPTPAQARGLAAPSIVLVMPMGTGSGCSPLVLVCLPRTASRLRSVLCPEAAMALAAAGSDGTRLG